MGHMQKTANHEAAHALVRWVNGFVIDHVTINPSLLETLPKGENAQGVIYTRDPSRDGHTDIIQHPKYLRSGEADSIIAGRVAEELFHKGDPQKGWAQDFRDLAALMPVDDRTLAMHQFCSTNPGQTEKFYRKFRKQVLDILSSKAGKRAHKAVSKALQNAGTLSGQAAVQILEKSWGKPLPAQAVPASGHVGLTLAGAKTYSDVLINLRTYSRVMKEEANRLRGSLSQKKEEHLSKVRFYLALLQLELGSEQKK